MEWPKTPHDIAGELQGTCDSLTAVLERHEMEGAENDFDFCNALDSVVFCCLSCDWWCDVSEMTDDPDHDWCCDDCYPKVGD